jgi:hypothetical protein
MPITESCLIMGLWPPKSVRSIDQITSGKGAVPSLTLSIYTYCKTGMHSVGLLPVHKDPFDRLIIATALTYEAQLASVDTLFPKYEELENYLMR